jgi:hypothetical protein
MPIISLPEEVVGLIGGYSDRLDLGTGNGRPGGIENVLEYNGAIFNVREWLDTILVTQIDGFSDADVRDSREVNPGRHGETAFNAFYGGRTIVITGKIRAHTVEKLRDMQQGLKEVFADISREHNFIIRTGNPTKDLMIACRKSQQMVMAEMQQDTMFHRDFQVTLRASNPSFLSYLPTLSTSDAATTVAETATEMFAPINEGNFPASPSFRIFGPVSSAASAGPALVISTTYTDHEGFATTYSMTLNAKSGTTLAIASGHYIEIDTATRTVKEYGASGEFVNNAFDQFDVTSDWIELQPGLNPIDAMPYTTVLPQVQVSHRHTFL